MLWCCKIPTSCILHAFPLGPTHMSGLWQCWLLSLCHPLRSDSHTPRGSSKSVCISIANLNPCSAFAVAIRRSDVVLMSPSLSFASWSIMYITKYWPDGLNELIWYKLQPLWTGDLQEEAALPLKSFIYYSCWTI